MRKRLLIYVLFWCCAGLAAQAQSRLLTGAITSEEGPLPGVNVMLKETTLSSTTDAKGKFTLSIPGDATKNPVFTSDAKETRS